MTLRDGRQIGTILLRGSTYYWVVLADGKRVAVEPKDIRGGEVKEKHSIVEQSSAVSFSFVALSCKLDKALRVATPEAMHEANAKLAGFMREWNKLRKIHREHMRELVGSGPRALQSIHGPDSATETHWGNQNGTAAGAVVNTTAVRGGV